MKKMRRKINIFCVTILFSIVTIYAMEDESNLKNKIEILKCEKEIEVLKQDPLSSDILSGLGGGCLGGLIGSYYVSTFCEEPHNFLEAIVKYVDVLTVLPVIPVGCIAGSLIGCLGNRAYKAKKKRPLIEEKKQRIQALQRKESKTE